MSITNSVAVVEGLCQRGGEFVRTPKGGARAVVGGLLDRLASRSVFVGITAAEIAFGITMLAGAAHFARLGQIPTALLLGFKSAGFLALAALSLRDLLPQTAPDAARSTPENRERPHWPPLFMRKG